MQGINAPDFIIIVCPSCATEYRIPVEYCGKDALCSNPSCGIMFQIPSLQEVMNPTEIVEPAQGNAEISTSTVKIERHGFLGMKPDPSKIKTGIDTSNFVVMSKDKDKKKRVFKI